jgi:ABC-type branched-subunit amino acid transport system ATPase component
MLPSRPSRGGLGLTAPPTLLARADVLIEESCRNLAAAGQTIVLVEQNLAATLALANRIYIINNGHIVHEGPAQEIKAQPEILQRYLGV